jgi:sugar O-acyltransferase (sialic acid O-acetyltransferase NeuD family)
MKPIILIGGGGHCVSCIDVIEQLAEYTIAGIIDLPEKMRQTVLGYSIVGCDNDIGRFVEGIYGFLITVGQVKSASLRRSLFQKVLQAGGTLPKIVSPSTYVSSYAKLGQGTIVMHRAVINAGAEIGGNCIINTGAIVEHDSRVEAHCHISTGAIVNGGCVVEEGCFLGSGSVLLQGLRIARDTVIGAGAVVTNPIVESGTYVGQPARRIRADE